MQQRRMLDIGRFLRLFVFAAVLFGGFTLSSAEVLASSDAWHVPEQQARDVEGDTFCPDRIDGITGRVVYCIQNIVITATETFLERFLDFYRPIVLATLALSITLYGALFLTGSVRRPANDTILQVIKIAAVVLFTTNFGGMILDVFNVMEGLMGVVSNYIVVSDISMCSPGGGSPLATVFPLFDRANPTAWDNIDCMFISLLGIVPSAVASVAGANAAAPAAAGIIILMVGLVFQGGIGIIIVLSALLFLLTLLVTVVRAVKIYLSSIIIVALLICVSPIILPMMLFSATKSLFTRWLGLMMCHILVPVFLMAYLSMIVAAIDALIFKGPSSLYYAVARDASDSPSFNMMTWLETGNDGEGNFVVDIPGTAAVGLQRQLRICESGTDSQKAVLGEMCDDIPRLQKEVQCARSPWVADGGNGEPLDMKDKSCEDLPDMVDGYYYYGYMMSVSIFNFAITPGRQTDAAAREDSGGCSGWLGCIWSGVKEGLGRIAGFVGDLVRAVGHGIKELGALVSAPCRLMNGVAGDVCDWVSGSKVLTFIGDTVHAAGEVVNFGSRVLLEGFLAAMGLDYITGGFDVKVVDLQKLASYHCYVDKNGGLSMDDYLDNCPSPAQPIIDILYVVLTAIVVIFLMAKWLPYITMMAQAMTRGSGANNLTSSELPGEDAAVGGLQNAVKKISSPTKIKRGGAK